MKGQLDFRTMCIALLIFSLGFATCFVVFGAPTVEADLDRLEVSEIVADRIVARQSLLSEGKIGFVNGPSLHSEGALIYCNGALEIGGNLLVHSWFDTATGYKVTGVTVLDYHRVFQNIYMDSSMPNGNYSDWLRQCPEVAPPLLKHCIPSP